MAHLRLATMPYISNFTVHPLHAPFRHMPDKLPLERKDLTAPLAGICECLLEHKRTRKGRGEIKCAIIQEDPRTVI